MTIDINPYHLEIVNKILLEHVPNCEVRAFGSRATWTAKDYSDLDLAIVGDGPLQWRTLGELRDAFEESYLPIRVDVLDWHDISDNFRKIIRDDCVVIFKNGSISEWKKLTLGQCIEIEQSSYSDKEAWPFINYLDTGSIISNSIRKIQRLVKGRDKIPTRARRKVKPGDIVYSMVRPNQKHFGLIKSPPLNFLVSTGFTVLRGKPNMTHTDFIYYLLTQERVVDYLQAIAENSTSAYPSIRPHDLEQLEVKLPPLTEQQNIAHILRTLDDKIELNRRMSETLEAMAQALFKSWFVDFDPIRAKMDGRWRPGESLPGFPAHLHDLFPDRLVNSELGEIPQDWKVKTLGDLCHKPQYGYTASANETQIGPKFLRITDINKSAWIDWSLVPYCKIPDEVVTKYQLHRGDIIIARIADPGHGCMIEENILAVFASYLIRFRPVYRHYSRFLQYWLRSDMYWKVVMQRIAGTTRSNLNAKALSQFPLIAPPISILNVFDTAIDNIRSQILANVNDSRVLANQRDILSPRLLSGDSQISKAIRQVETVV